MLNINIICYYQVYIYKYYKRSYEFNKNIYDLGHYDYDY